MSGFVRKWEKIEFSISGVCVLNFYCRLDGTGKPRELPLEIEQQVLGQLLGGRSSGDFLRKMEGFQKSGVLARKVAFY